VNEDGASDRLSADLRAAGVDQHWVELSHGKQRYLEAGSGPPLLLLHGMGFSGAADRFLWHMPLLAPHFRVIAVDLLGWGLGDRPKFEYSSSCHIVEALRELQDGLDLSSSFFVGHCIGGRYALELTRQSPGRVRRLIVAAMSTRRVPGAVLTPEQFRAPTSKAELLEWTVARHGLVDFDYDQLVEWDWPKYQLPDAVESYRNLLRHFQDPSQRKQADLRSKKWPAELPPITFLWPDADESAPVADIAGITGAIPSARIVMTEGNHFFPYKHPARFSQLIVENLLAAPVAASAPTQ
jgi:pimeloyl-ACP methyl ester carboxylesterase